MIQEDEQSSSESQEEEDAETINIENRESMMLQAQTYDIHFEGKILVADD